MTEDKEIIAFYLELKEERMNQNLELDKISEKTKISIKHLKLIESGDFKTIPTTYLRLFIKTYAQYLKLDYKKILNNYELESNKKSKNIFKKQKDNKKVKKQKIDIKKSLSNFNLSESYYLEPKKIIQIAILFSFLLSTYLFISYLSKKQADIIVEDMASNNTSLTNDEIDEVAKEDRESLLNSSDFLNRNLKKSKTFKLNKEIGSNYTFQISTKEKTKIYISFNDDDGNRIEKCNIIADKGELIKYTFSNNIYFDLLSAKHVQVSINNNSINKYLGKEDYSIRGSFEPSNKQLYLEFYSK
tara:strand:+ start:1658 stop:2560 length:903 start_codon:yes stop_codon:yes gene_type:complete